MRPNFSTPDQSRANQNTAFRQAESAILICSSQIRSLPKLLSNQGTARAVTWELRRQISIVTGTVEAKFNMGDTYACTARATTWELRRQISTR